MASAANDHLLIEAVAAEISAGIETALTFWMGQIQSVLEDPRLTTLGRMHAIQEIVNRYSVANSAGIEHHGYAA